MEKLGSSNKVLYLVFGRVTSIFTRDVALVVEKDTRCVLNVECLLQLGVNGICINQAQFELSFSLEQCILECLLSLG
jgi:hypothetical protein